MDHDYPVCFKAAVRATAITANLTRSRGIALIAGLLLMTSMVVLSLAIATGVLLERRMAGNFGDSQLALQRAQLAGQWGEYWLMSRPETPLPLTCGADCDAMPIYPPGLLPFSPEVETEAWWQMMGQPAGVEPVSGLVKLDYSLPNAPLPRWLIEEVHLEPMEEWPASPDGEEPMLGFYRILAFGLGRQPGSIAVTEAIVARPWADDLDAGLFPPVPQAPRLCDQLLVDVPCGRQGWRRRR